MTPDNSAICVFFLVRYGDFLVLVTLTAILLSNIVDIEWKVSGLAICVNFSDGVTVPVVFHSEDSSTNTVIVFVVLEGIVRALSGMTPWVFRILSLEAALTYTVKCGKCMRPCVVSMTTQMFLINCNPIFSPVIFLHTTKYSANILSPISILGVVVASGFSNWPFSTCIRKLGWSLILRTLFGAFSFIVPKPF